MTSRKRSTVRRHQRSPLFSLANISVTVQLQIQVFWVISVQFDLRNTLPKSGPFLLLHPVQRGLLAQSKLRLGSTVFYLFVLPRTQHAFYNATPNVLGGMFEILLLDTNFILFYTRIIFYCCRYGFRFTIVSSVILHFDFLI